MSAADEAYEAALREVARYRAQPQLQLSFDLERFRHLDRLPAGLATLPGLLTLYLDNTSVRDLSGLAGLVGLTHLSLKATAVRDLGPISGLRQLRVLALAGSPVQEIEPLASLPRLARLSLDRTGVTDLSPLASLADLMTLTITETRVTDLSPLAGLYNLETLGLQGTQVADLRPICDLPKLSGRYGALGLTFRGTPAVERDPELRRLSEIRDDPERTLATKAYLKTLPPWPGPHLGNARGGDDTVPATAAARKLHVTETQISALISHALTTRITAEILAARIDYCLQGVPAAIGANTLPPVLQTMQDIAEVLRRLAPEPQIEPEPLERPELLVRISELEAKVAQLTDELMDAKQARDAADALTRRSEFWSHYRKGTGTSLGQASGTIATRLMTVGALSAAAYFLGAAHPLVEACQTALSRLPR